MRQKVFSKRMGADLLRIWGVLCSFLLIVVSNAYPLAIADVTVYEQSNYNDHQEGPSTASANLSNLLASGWAEVNIPTGTLKTFVQTTTGVSQGAQVSAYGSMDDYFTLLGLPQGNPVWITASLNITGTLFTPPGQSSNWYSGWLAYFGGPYGDTLLPDPGGEMVINTVLSQVYFVFPGEPFRVVAELSSYGWGWDQNDIQSDFSGTATLNFNLPEGTWISSEEGFYQSTSPIPEPATMLLLGSGLIGLAGYGRKKFFKK